MRVLTAPGLAPLVENRQANSPQVFLKAASYVEQPVPRFSLWAEPSGLLESALRLSRNVWQSSRSSVC